MLERAAEESGRSVTAETVERLRASFSTEKNLINSMFLMSRLEVRAVQAEVEVLRMKASLALLAVSLQEAMRHIDEEKLRTNPKFADRLPTFNEHLDMVRKIVDFENDNGEFQDSAGAKLMELQSATKKAMVLFDQLTTVSTQDQADAYENGKDKKGTTNQ